MRIDEFTERTEEESKKELEDYRRFVYIKLNTLPDTSVNQDTSTPKSSSVTELKEVQIESQVPRSHSEAIEPMPIEFEQLKLEVKI